MPHRVPDGEQASASPETAWLEHFAAWSPADVVPYPPHPGAAARAAPGPLPGDHAASEVWSAATRGGRAVVGRYAAGGRYENADPARPAHLNFHKVDRVNVAAFQADAGGRVWGTDPWADPLTLL